MHYDLKGNIDRWGSKYEKLIFPVLILLISLFFTLLMGYFEKKARAAAEEKDRAGTKSNARVIGFTAIAMALLYTVLHGVGLLSAYREARSGASTQAVDFLKLTTILFGVLMIVLGNVLPKTRNNSVIGTRLSWSMYNDTTWRKSNRFSAFALMLTGILTVLLAAILKSSVAAILAFLGLLALACAAVAVYSYNVYTQERNKEKGES